MFESAGVHLHLVASASPRFRHVFPPDVIRNPFSVKVERLSGSKKRDCASFLQRPAISFRTTVYKSHSHALHLPLCVHAPSIPFTHAHTMSAFIAQSAIRASRTSSVPRRQAIQRAARQVRYNSSQAGHNASTPAANGSSAVVGGLVGGGLVIAAGYGYYYFSVSRTVTSSHTAY